MKTIKAVLRAGYQVASGQSQTDLRFPLGTIRMQAPFFKERGLDFDTYFDGNFRYATLNLSIAPRFFRIGKTSYHFKNVEWTDVLPAETFFLSPAQLRFKGNIYKALIYIPDPETKPDHQQGTSVLEIIANKVPDIAYGDEIELLYDPQEIQINEAACERT
ncbi:MAG: hypothetical protein PHD48_04810 [Alphaproteobacteria bacterium]|nr:hypothetical protein [Alphaproteobacteria bacterium]